MDLSSREKGHRDSALVIINLLWDENVFCLVTNLTARMWSQSLFLWQKHLNLILGSQPLFCFSLLLEKKRGNESTRGRGGANQIDHLWMKRRGIKEIRRVKRSPTGSSPAKQRIPDQVCLCRSVLIRLFLSFPLGVEWECGFVWEKSRFGAD